MTTRNRLRDIRTQRGKTQQGLAAEAGCAVSYVQRLEYGQSSPTLHMAQRIAKALGATVEEIWPPAGDAQE